MNIPIGIYSPKSRRRASVDEADLRREVKKVKGPRALVVRLEPGDHIMRKAAGTSEIAPAFKEERQEGTDTLTLGRFNIKRRKLLEGRCQNSG